MNRAAILALAFVLISTLALADIAGQASVIDGDTIEVEGVKVRLHGIDAPELDQPCWKADGTEWPCGEVAAKVLGKLIARGTRRSERPARRKSNDSEMRP